MKVFCPACSVMVPATHIYLDKGWGKCEACHELFQLADVLPLATGFTPAFAPPVERPFNARATIERSKQEMVVHVPAEGMRAATWGMLGFATFWLGFIAFWTAGASGLFFGNGGGPVNWLFACFSIPFWIVGFGMLGGILWKARGVKTVRFDTQEMVARQQCGVWSRTRHIELDRVQRARPFKAQVQGDMVQQSGIEIVYEKGSFMLPADSDEERQWLIFEINDFLEAVST